MDQSGLGLDPSPPFPSRNNPETSPTPTPNYYFEGARSGDRKGEGEKSETEDNPKGLTLPDDSTQLIIISLSVCLSLRLVSESGSGFWQRRPRGERLEVTAWAVAAFSLERSPGSPRLLRSWWHGPRGSGRASSRASGGAGRSRQAPAASQSSALSLQNRSPSRRCERLIQPPLSPLPRRPLPRSLGCPLGGVLLPLSSSSSLILLPTPHHHNNHLRTEDTLTQDLKR